MEYHFKWHRTESCVYTCFDWLSTFILGLLNYYTVKVEAGYLPDWSQCIVIVRYNCLFNNWLIPTDDVFASTIRTYFCC